MYCNICLYTERNIPASIQYERFFIYVKLLLSGTAQNVESTVQDQQYNSKSTL